MRHLAKWKSNPQFKNKKFQSGGQSQQCVGACPIDQMLVFLFIYFFKSNKIEEIKKNTNNYSFMCQFSQVCILDSIWLAIHM